MRCRPLSNMAREPSEKPLTSGGMSNPLPSAEQYGAQTVVKAVDERKNERSAAPSAVQYGTQSVVKTVDEWKNEQSAAIR